MHAEFFAANRAKLKKQKGSPSLIVIAGNSFMQASADRAFKFQQDTNFFYLTGVNEPGTVLVIDGQNEYLILPEKSQARIVFEGATDKIELSQASGISQVYGHKDGWEKLNQSLKTAKQAGILKPLSEYIKSIDMLTNPSRRHLQKKLKKQNPKLKFVDLRQALSSLRMIKSSYEIEMIEKAIENTAELFKIIEKHRAKAKNEKELYAEIVREAVNRQLDFAYEPIIASGINAITLHYENNNSPIAEKGVLLLDVGLKYQGYAADITRSVVTKPTKRQQEVYDSVLRIQEYAIKLLKPGQLLKNYETEIYRFAGVQLQQLGLIKEITKESVRKYCPHATSHWLGLDVHDAGDYEAELQPGMVLTVEPGIYIKEEKIGIRIEDDILITKEGNRVLSGNLPKNLCSLTIQA